jgi:hypothetical protein
MISFAGRLVKCRYEVCGCMSAPECLMEHHLWASSVASPTIAYSLDLMRQAEVFMLEARVSLKAFCLALRWKNNLSENQVRIFVYIRYTYLVYCLVY